MSRNHVPNRTYVNYGPARASMLFRHIFGAMSESGRRCGSYWRVMGAEKDQAPGLAPTGASSVSMTCASTPLSIPQSSASSFRVSNSASVLMRRPSSWFRVDEKRAARSAGALTPVAETTATLSTRERRSRTSPRLLGRGATAEPFKEGFLDNVQFRFHSESALWPSNKA